MPVYYVIDRGRGRRETNYGPRWYQALLDGLDEAHERYDPQIHHYHLMTNRYHLPKRTPRGDLYRIMRHIDGVYTKMQ